MNRPGTTSPPIFNLHTAKPSTVLPTSKAILLRPMVITGNHRENPAQRTTQPGICFDTTNFLFICGGAFVGLEDNIAKKVGCGGLGFD